MKIHLLPLALVATSLLCAGQFAAAGPGDLDPSFGNDGRVLTRFPIDSATFQPRSNSRALAIQPDARIVSAGQAMVQHSQGGEPFAFALVRYNPDGTLDK